MKVAVTGASGFIGRHVLQALIRKGIRPVAVTRCAERLAEFEPAVAVVELDLAQPSDSDFSQLGHPEVVLHLAWNGLPNYQALHHFETELGHQYRFLKSLVEAGLPALVVTGTCLEYGLQQGLLSEQLPTDPTTPYGLAKDTLRKELQFLARACPFALTWARLFYSYGEGQFATSLYPSFQACVRQGDAEFKMSAGEQVRDFLPIEALADMLVEATLGGKELGVVNVCSGVPITVRHLVEEWLKTAQHKPRLNLGHYPYLDYEPMAFWGDRTRWNQLMKASTP